MPPHESHLHSAWQKAEHTLGQLMVLFGASVLIVFVLQIPPSQAAGGDPSPDCRAGTMYCQKKEWKGGAMLYKLSCNDAKEKKDKKKRGLIDKPCKVIKNATTCTGKCTGNGMECKGELGVSTCNGKKTKKADPKSGAPKKADPMSGEKKDDKGGEMPKLPDMKPPEKKPKEPAPKQEPQNQQPCQKDQYGNVKFPATPPGCNPNPVQ